MAEAEGLTAQELRQRLDYNPKTGEFFWKRRDDGGSRAVASWNERFAGRAALTNKHPKGYLQGAIKKRSFLAHRAAWAITHGEWPSNQIDHINGDRSDNRLDNLREFTAGQNARNRKRREGRKGKVGVTWYADCRKWRAQIQANGVHISLGYYDDYKAAVAARLEAERDLGFDKNHARYAPLTPVKNSRFAI